MTNLGRPPEWLVVTSAVIVWSLMLYGTIWALPLLYHGGWKPFRIAWIA